MAKLYKQSDFNSNNTISLASTYDRLNGYPLYNKQVWDNLDSMAAYAATNTAYEGEILSLATASLVRPYYVSGSTVKEIGSDLTNIKVSGTGNSTSPALSIQTTGTDAVIVNGNLKINGKLISDGQEIENDTIQKGDLVIKDGDIIIERNDEEIFRINTAKDGDGNITVTFL